MKIHFNALSVNNDDGYFDRNALKTRDWQSSFSLDYKPEFWREDWAPGRADCDDILLISAEKEFEWQDFQVFKDFETDYLAGLIFEEESPLLFHENRLKDARAYRIESVRRNTNLFTEVPNFWEYPNGTSLRIVGKRQLSEIMFVKTLTIPQGIIGSRGYIHAEEPEYSKDSVVIQSTFARPYEEIEIQIPPLPVVEAYALQELYRINGNDPVVVEFTEHEVWGQFQGNRMVRGVLSVSPNQTLDLWFEQTKIKIREVF